MKVKQIVFKHTDMQRETKTYLYLGLAEIKKKLRFQLGLLTKMMHEPCVSKKTKAHLGFFALESAS